jgi:hypothetical protein
VSFGRWVILLLSLGLGVGRIAVALQVLFSISFTDRAESHPATQLLIAMGEAASMVVDDQYRLVLQPQRTTDDIVEVIANIYQLDGEQQRLMIAPHLMSRDGEEAVIRIEGANGAPLECRIRSHGMR